MSNFLFSRYFKQHPCTLMVIDDTVVLCLKVLCTLLRGKRLCICHCSGCMSTVTADMAVLCLKMLCTLLD